MTVFEKLKEYLPPGSILKTARKFKKDPSYISKVRSGQIKNPAVLEHLVKTAETYKLLLDRIEAL